MWHLARFLTVVLFVHQVTNTQAIQSCYPDPCENGATCVTASNGESYCLCGQNYIGKYCQYDNPCRPETDFCENNGTCIVNQDVEIKSTCHCQLGFTGTLCELLDPNSVCYNNPCQNQGTCHNTISLRDYMCTCKNGFTGNNCQFIDYCSTQPCRNSGECLSLEDGFMCTCKPGYTGDRCMSDVDECAENPNLCQNGGQCDNRIGSYMCSCPLKYIGKNCEQLYFPCSPSPCLNSGTCVTSGEVTYQCLCKSGRLSPL